MADRMTDTTKGEALPAHHFRKKPVVIEALQWTGDNYAAVSQFVCSDQHHELARKGADLLITTMEDGPNGEAQHWANLLDWIIKGVRGELYPCKPDIFAATYESAALADKAGEPDDEKVICPACSHQFRAIPVQVQQLVLSAGLEPPFTSPGAPAPGWQSEVQKVALDIAKWAIQGDRPDVWKLAEWALALDLDAIDKAYAWQGAAPASPTVPAPKEMNHASR